MIRYCRHVTALCPDREQKTHVRKGSGLRFGPRDTVNAFAPAVDFSASNQSCWFVTARSIHSPIRQLVGRSFQHPNLGIILISQPAQDYHIDILEVHGTVDGLELFDHSIDSEDNFSLALIEFHLCAVEIYSECCLLEATGTVVLNELSLRFAWRLGTADDFESDAFRVRHK